MHSALVTHFAMLDPQTVMLAMLIFFLAGIIKGVVGFGMPLFAITLLALSMPLSTAIAANVGPSFFTNVRQAFRGPHLRALVVRLWPFLLLALGFIWVGVAIQLRVDQAYAGLALGVLATSFAGLRLFKVQLSVPPCREKPLGIVIGAINGVVTGITGVFIIPGALYVQALGLSRDALVQALGLFFMLSSAMIALVFGFNALMTPSLILLSLLCIPPAFAGLAIGERLRSKLSEAMFATLFLFGIAALGLTLIVHNGGALLAGALSAPLSDASSARPFDGLVFALTSR